MILRVSVGVHTQNLLHLFLQVAVSDEGSGRATSWCDLVRLGATVVRQRCDLVEHSQGATWYQRYPHVCRKVKDMGPFSAPSA